MNTAHTLALIRQHSQQLLPEQDLIKKLNKGIPLNIKLGMDPTSPDLHLGHAVVLKKLKQFSV